jgi:DNA-binding NarL/FixJ family response regulator
MIKDSNLKLLRILAVDDDHEMLRLYGDVLTLEGKGYGPESCFEVIQCSQGDEALKAADKAFKQGKPFSVIFLDLNMPPGPDGIWTGERIRNIDPHVNFVIVTGLPDIDPGEIAMRIPPQDKIFFVQKPFHARELRQFAMALGARWESEILLKNTHIELEKKVEELEKSRQELLMKRKEVENVNQQLMETNNALSVLARNLDRTKTECEKQILERVRHIILPIAETIRKSGVKLGYKADLDLLIDQVISLSNDLSNDIGAVASLSTAELRIASMIRNGMSSIEIADHLYISLATVKTHRKNIRRKLGLKDTKINLRLYLESE